MMARLTVAVYVPNDDLRVRALRLADGSAIVGEPTRDAPAMRRIYYEGNVFGASSMVTYADRVDYAAVALDRRFPTTATANVPASALHHVGEFVLATRTLIVHDHDALAAWLGFDVGRARRGAVGHDRSLRARRARRAGSGAAPTLRRPDRGAYPRAAIHQSARQRSRRRNEMSAKHNAERRRRSPAGRVYDSVVLSQSDVDTLVHGGVVDVEHAGGRRQINPDSLTFTDLQRLRRGERVSVLTSGADGAATTVVQGPQPQ